MGLSSRRFAAVALASLAGLGCSPTTAGPGAPAAVTLVAPASPKAGIGSSPPGTSDIAAQCRRGIGALFGSLQQPMEVDLHITRSDPELERLAKALDEVMQELQASSGGKLVYRSHDASTPDAQEIAKEEGLQEFLIGDDDGTNLARGYSGFVLKYGSEQGQIPIIEPDSLWTFEFWLASKVRELRAIVHERPSRIGIVAREGASALTEPDLVATTSYGPGPNLRGLFEEQLPYYRFVDVPLDREIEPELDGLVLTQPEVPLGKAERQRIDDYLMRGGALAVFASAVSLKRSDPSMTAELDDRGTADLLAPYGIEMERGAVLDPTLAAKFAVLTETGKSALLTLPAILSLEDNSGEGASKGRLDGSFAGFIGLHEVAFPYPSPLVVHDERQPNATIRIVAQSSADARVDDNVTQDMGLRRVVPSVGATRSIPLAVVVEGRLTSAFGGKSATAPARIFVVSSSQFLANPFARAGNPPPLPPQMQMMGSLGGDKELQTVAGPYAQKYMTKTILAFKNTLDWMSSDEDLIACSALLASAPKDEPEKKCTKEEVVKLMDAGLSVEEAADVCRKK